MGATPVIYQEGNEQNLFKQKGTLAEWQENIAKLCVGNSRLVLSVSAAFAAALLKLIDAESGGFHIFGDSSCGKTTTLRVAGSVCGGGGTNGYLRQWRATDNGLEAIAAAHCDSLLCLDEMGQASGKVVSECSYMLANGQGKGRATKEGGARPSKNWRLLLLSTGEVTLSTKISEEGKSRAKAGQEVRVLDIPADAQAGFGIFETIHGYPSADAFARHLKGMTTMYYGTPLRAFLEALVANRENVEARIRESLRSFENSFCPKGADGQVQRACARFGLAAAAGKLAAEFGILPWEEAEAIKAAEVCFKAWIQQRGGIGARELSTGIEQVRMFFQQYGSTRFAEIHEDGAFSYDRGYRMGYRRTTNGREQFLVFPETFRNEICKGFNHIALAKEIERLGHLEPGGDGRLDQKLSTPSGRFYVVGDSILTGEDGEMGKSPLTLFFGDEPRGREAAIETSLNVLPSVDPDQTITPASSAATIA